MDEQSPIIVRTEGIVGGRPRIDGTRISVAHIVAYYQVLLDDMIIQQLLNAFPHLTETQVWAALEYYRDHREEIDEVLRENREVYRAHG